MADPAFLTVNTEVDLVEVVISGRALNVVIQKLVAAVNELAADLRGVQARVGEDEANKDSLREQIDSVRDMLDKESGAQHAIDALKAEITEVRQVRDNDKADVDALTQSLHDTNAHLEVRVLPDVACLEHDVALLRTTTTDQADVLRHIHETLAADTGSITTQVNELSAASDRTASLLGSVMSLFSLEEQPTTTALSTSTSTEYLLSTPIFTHFTASIGSLASKVTSEATRTTDVDVALSDKILKTNQRLVTKLDKDTFASHKAEAASWRETLEDMEKKVAQLDAEMQGKASEETMLSEVMQLETTKADRAELLALPSRDVIQALKIKLEKMEDKLGEHMTATDVQLRQLANRKPSLSAAPDHKEVERMRKSIDVLKTNDVLLDENKVDRAEWRNIQDFVEEVSREVAQLGRTVGAPVKEMKMPNRDNEERQRRASMIDTNEPLTKGSFGQGAAPNRSSVTSTHNAVPSHSTKPTHGAAPTHNAVPTYNVAPTHSAVPTHGPAPTHSAVPTYSAAPTHNTVSNGAAGSASLWESSILKRPQSAGPSSFPQGKAVPSSLSLPRPASAGPTNSYMTDYQASVPVPLQHIPAGLRMGRPSRLTTLDGLATNATVTPRIDLEHHHHSPSPSHPRITSKSADLVD